MIIWAIAKVLKENKTLTLINLSWNKIGDVGAEAIAAALSGKTPITSIKLNDLIIGPKQKKDYKIVDENKKKVGKLAEKFIKWFGEDTVINNKDVTFSKILEQSLFKKTYNDHMSFKMFQAADKKRLK